MFNSILATGQIFGPLYAMGAVSLVGFRYACDIQAVAILVFCACYFIFGEGCSAVKESSKAKAYASTEASVTTSI